MRSLALTRDVTTDGTRMQWIGYVATILWWSGVVRSLSSLNRGHSYKISPKPCRVAGSSSLGTCMFVWECIKSEGTHVGVCVDTFMFGSCCVRNETSSTSSSSSSSPSTTLGTTTTSSSTTDRVVPQHQFLSGGSSTIQGYGNPERPSSSSLFVGGPGRPLQKRPQGKPSSEYHDYGGSMHKYPNVGWSKLPQNVGARPLNRPTTDAFDSGGYHHGFADKIDDVSTTATRLPGKNQDRNSNYESLRTRPPGSSGWNVGTHTHLVGQDSVAHETVYHPSYLHNQPEEKSTSTYRPVSIIDHDRDHDERPNFVSRPETWKKPTKSRTTPKPDIYQSSHDAAHFSTSGSSAQTTHWRVTTEPAFVTKLSTTTTTTTYADLSSIQSTTISPPASATASNIGSTGTSANGNKGDSGFWSEHSWTSASDSLIKPHWNDGQSVNKEPERYQNRPSFESTESQQNAEYDKPSIGAAHYITTDDLGTALTRPRPTRRRKPSLSGTKGATSSLVPDRTKNRPTSAMTPSTTASSTSTSVATIGPPSSTGKTSMASISKTTTTTPIPTRTTMAATTTTTTATTMTSTTSKPTTTTTTTTTTTILSSSNPPRKTLGSVPTVSAVGQGEKTECGVPALFPRPETRIVGGKDAPFGRWPWQVSVRRTSFFGFSSTHRCGGAVLNANWIATAGHCVDDLLTSQIRIRVGDYDFSSVQERLPYVERGIAKKVVHPKYNFFTYEYDLALVRLESALIFAPHISPICLPATDDLLIGENATVTGWGRLSEGGTLPSVLQEVSVPIVSNDQCKSMFFRAGRHEFIPEIFLCAGYEGGGQDSCQGDSGGPLQVRGKDGRYFLAGIISWGIGCAEANLPGVCTRISKFVSWILKNVT